MPVLAAEGRWAALAYRSSGSCIYGRFGQVWGRSSLESLAHSEGVRFRPSMAQALSIRSWGRHSSTAISRDPLARITYWSFALNASRKKSFRRRDMCQTSLPVATSSTFAVQSSLAVATNRSFLAQKRIHHVSGMNQNANLAACARSIMESTRPPTSSAAGSRRRPVLSRAGHSSFPAERRPVMPDAVGPAD